MLVAALSAELVMGTGPGALSLGTAWAPSLSMSFLIGWTVTRGLYVYVTACYYFFLPSPPARPFTRRCGGPALGVGFMLCSDSSMSLLLRGMLILASVRSLLLLRASARVPGAHSTRCRSYSKNH